MPAMSVVKNDVVMPILPVRSEVVPLTIELAAEFRDMTPMPGERPLNEYRIAFLIKAIQEAVLPFQWYVVEVNGRIYRINGQTTSYMFCEDPKLILPGMGVCLTTYEADTMEEASTVYGAVDSARSARSISDITNSFHAGNPRLQKHKKTFVNRCQTGLAYYAFGLRYDRRRDITPLQRGRLLAENLDFIDETAKIIPKQGPEYTHLWRAPVIAAMRATYEVDKIAFRSFWSLTQHGNNTPVTITKLRDYLRTTNLSVSKLSGRTDSSPNMYEKCVRAWNAWRQNRTMNKCLATGTIPKAI